MNEKITNIYEKNNNLIINGNINSGKTTNVLFPLVEKMIDNQESMFILDSKEEYLNKYYEILKNNNYNIITINLRNPLNSEGWNPLSYPYQLYKNGNFDEALSLLDNISENLFYEKTATDPFWLNSASDIFTASVLGLFQDAKEDEINLLSVESILDNFGTRYETSTYSKAYFNSKNTDSIIYEYAKSIVNAPKDTLASILSVARQKTRLYVSRENLNYMLNHTTFNFEDILNKKTAIFFINHDEKCTYSRLVNVFMEQLYSVLLKNNHKFNIILDNFDSLDSFKNLDQILSSCLARKIKVYLATRSFDRIIDDYTNYIEKLTNRILINKDTVDIIIDNELVTIPKDFVEMNILKNHTEYPVLEKKDTQIFSLIDFVNINYEEINKFEKKEATNVEDLLKKIDEKIAELEKEV